MASGNRGDIYVNLVCDLGPWWWTSLVLQVVESTGSPGQEDEITLSVKFAPVLSPVTPSRTVNISSQVSQPVFSTLIGRGSRA